MDEESLFALHARHRAGEAVPDGWYRDGTPLGGNAWVVDLDLFVEVVLDAATWEEVKGDVLQLGIGEETYDIEVPADAEPEDCWTLPGAGLFEAAPGVTDEELAEAEDAEELGTLGRFGDLHVVPVLEGQGAS